jgi:carbon starvation protein CstA
VSNSGQQSQPSQASKVTPDSNSVQSYLNILQGIITRMATNSANCKTWCVSLVSAILVVIADKNKPNYAWITLIPIVLFFLLDSYYLGQERNFREIYNNFVKELHSGEVATDKLFVLKPPKGINVVNLLFSSSLSFSVYPFYLTLVLTVIIARFLIL